MIKTCRLIIAFSLIISTGSFAGYVNNHSSDSLIRGIVYHDKSGTGSYIPDEDLPLPGIGVSNGRDVVITDADGSYELPVDDHSIIFVIKPKNWMVPVDENQMPRFYYVHSTTGAKGEMYSGLEPTGQVPPSVDFPLRPQHEPDKFDLLVFGDTQPRNSEEIHYISRDMLTGLDNTNAAFGVTLGDIVFDDLNLSRQMIESISTIGIPWHYVQGNHDIDPTAISNRDAKGPWYNTYGPSYYSFSRGPVHFILLDNIRLVFEDGRTGYKAGLGEDQLEFLKNEFSRLDRNQLVVLFVHIPWEGSTGWQDEGERATLYEILAGHPNSVSLVAHTHQHYHQMIGKESGFPGSNPHHMVSIGAVCGSWWTGAPDEYGIPHAMMSDGTPTSYAIMHIDKDRWQLSWRAARRPEDFQMSIFAPDEVSVNESAGITVTANIFNALPDAEVEMKIGESGEWIRMEKISEIDPSRVAVAEREAQLENVPWRSMGGPQVSRHLWRAQPLSALEPGANVIHIRAKDAWWEYKGNHIIYVR